MSRKSATEAPEVQAGMEAVRVTLLKDHTHEGREYPAGESIVVEGRQVQWLVQQKVIDTPRQEA
jgi:hypothetical protein